MIALSFLRTVMSLLRRSGPAVRRRLQPRLVSGDAVFPAGYLIRMLEREGDIVEAFEQAHAIGGGNVEGDIGTAGTADALTLEIDGEWRRAVHRSDASLECIRFRRSQHDRQKAVLQAVLAIDIGEASRHDDADIIGQHSPYRSLARGARAEIVTGDQNAGLPELRLVEHEIGVLAAVVPPPRAHEQQRLVVRLELAHRLHRRDLVGVDVVLDQRDGDAGVMCERLHQASPGGRCRTSVMRPARAVAAAVAGLTRCVRTFGPCRCSKLRLVVETQRSPGSPRSPLPPAHIEHPDSPHKNPASRKTRSRPAASAARFTVVEPGTTIAMTPSATWRPRTTAAAACRSGRRPLVPEPMNTRSTRQPARGLPGP